MKQIWTFSNRPRPKTRPDERPPRPAVAVPDPDEEPVQAPDEDFDDSADTPARPFPALGTKRS